MQLKLYMCAVAFVGILFCFSCQSEMPTPKSEQLEIYSIVLSGDSTKIGKLTYKEIKYYNATGDVIKQEFFDRANELKGIEYIDKTKEKRHSEYFTPDSSLLSYYDMDFSNEQLEQKSAYDGPSGEFLRKEEYKYDEKGYRTEKIIYDAGGAISRVYKFVYDEFGNELGFSGFDEVGTMFLMETYSITEKDKYNRWTEKWGKRQNVPYSYYKRIIKN